MSEEEQDQSPLLLVKIYDPELKKWARFRAKKERISMSALVRGVILKSMRADKEFRSSPGDAP